MSKSFFIDTTLCTGCRGCQVACKQWHGLPAEKTINRGTFENPPDVSFTTYKLVRMREEIISGKLNWLFFPEQCRHCIEPPCLEEASDPSALFKDETTGAIIFTAETKNLNTDDIIDVCPYNIPRKGPDGTLAKCDMCLDRVKNGLLPACVQTCPTGTMNFGERDEMLEMAEKRLKDALEKHPRASLIDSEDVRVIYLVIDNPNLYFENALAVNTSYGITRKAALKKMVKPLTNLTRLT
jgi:formate dehydrogenase iron-sulfur subunit